MSHTVQWKSVREIPHVERAEGTVQAALGQATTDMWTYYVTSIVHTCSAMRLMNHSNAPSQQQIASNQQLSHESRHYGRVWPSLRSGLLLLWTTNIQTRSFHWGDCRVVTGTSCYSICKSLHAHQEVTNHY